jgi:hypothetical protein
MFDNLPKSIHIAPEQHYILGADGNYHKGEEAFTPDQMFNELQDQMNHGHSFVLVFSDQKETVH